MTGLIRFAGDDRNEPRLLKEWRKHLPSCDTMFFNGRNTAEIASVHEITEAQALKRISLERSKRLGLPSPYEPRASVSQATRVTAGEVENTSVSLAGLSMQVRP